jgi:hypothetical protein
VVVVVPAAAALGRVHPCLGLPQLEVRRCCRHLLRLWTAPLHHLRRLRPLLQLGVPLLPLLLHRPVPLPDAPQHQARQARLLLQSRVWSGLMHHAALLTQRGVVLLVLVLGWWVVLLVLLRLAAHHRPRHLLVLVAHRRACLLLQLSHHPPLQLRAPPLQPLHPPRAQPRAACAGRCAAMSRHAAVAVVVRRRRWVPAPPRRPAGCV